MPDVLIVGAGAAGLATAIFTRRVNPSRSVLLLDGARRPGAKILVSGGSRCNLTNTAVSDRDFWGGRRTIIRQILRAFTTADAVRFFEGLGIAVHEEADGKLFPDTNRSRDVLDALLREINSRGVQLQVEQRVERLARAPGGFVVMTSRGEVGCRNAVLATGGRSLPRTGSDGAGLELARTLGHTIVATTPALAPLLLDPAAIRRELAGVSQDVELTVWREGAVHVRLAGRLLWTHFGVSGPVALDASRHWMRAQVENRAATVTINMCPGQSFEAVDRQLLQANSAAPRTSIATLLARLVPGSVAAMILSCLAVEPALPLAQLTRQARRRIVHALVEWPLPVAGTRGYNFAEVTAGGVALDEIDPATMQSRICPGLFLVGEILDVDGRLGGFNFQWAWSTGFVAGRALASIR